MIQYLPLVCAETRKLSHTGTPDVATQDRAVASGAMQLSVREMVVTVGKIEVDSMDGHKWIEATGSRLPLVQGAYHGCTKAVCMLTWPCRAISSVFEWSHITLTAVDARG